MQNCLSTLLTTSHSLKFNAMLSERLHTTLHKKMLCNFALILLGQHCTGKNLMQCCLKGSRQHCIRKNSVQCCLNTLGTTLHRTKPYAQDKTLCNVVREAPDNTVSEKVLCNVVLILLGQHCTEQNPIPIQCCLSSSRQVYVRKNPVQCCFNILGITLPR